MSLGAVLALAGMLYGQPPSSRGSRPAPLPLIATYPEAPRPPAPPPRVLAPGAKLVHGSRKIKAVALTFDDGPHPAYTPQILSVLDEHRVQATFFVVGKMAEAYPELVAEEAARGHVIGDHSYNHVSMDRLSYARQREEWARCREVIEGITGRPVYYCRPPIGRYNGTTLAAARDEGLSMVLWSRYPSDISKPGRSAIVSRATRGVRNGEVILLHDGVQQTIEALPEIITRLREQGFELQTIQELAARAGADTQVPTPRTAEQTAGSAPARRRGRD